MQTDTENLLRLCFQVKFSLTSEAVMWILGKSVKKIDTALDLLLLLWQTAVGDV